VTCLFAALNVAAGQVTDACYPWHRHQEFLKFLKFLKKIAAAYPGTDLHVICGNYGTHKHAGVRAWLAANPRVTPHFTPASCSWLNPEGVLLRRDHRAGNPTAASPPCAS